LPEKFFDSARKNCKITLPDSLSPVIISKNSRFWALYLASYCLIDTNFFVIFGCWLLPENLAFAQKMMVLPESGGCSPPSPLARTPMDMVVGRQVGHLDVVEFSV